MKNIIKTTLLAGLAVSVLGTAAHAATATSTFTAKIVIENDCSVSSPNDLDFGTVGLLSSNKDTSMDFTVTCTNGADYTIAMDNGQNASGSTNRMKNGSEYVSYELYQDNSYSTVWDDSSTVGSTGTGTAQTFTVYGRVPPQATPTAGTYTDTVTITVTY